MNNKLPEIEEPLNANERFLYQCAIRLDALCHMVSSLVEHIAERDGVSTTSNKVEEKVDVKSTPTQCVGKTRGGKRCKNTAEEGSEFCAIHNK